MTQRPQPRGPVHFVECNKPMRGLPNVGEYVSVVVVFVRKPSSDILQGTEPASDNKLKRMFARQT